MPLDVGGDGISKQPDDDVICMGSNWLSPHRVRLGIVVTSTSTSDAISAVHLGSVYNQRPYIRVTMHSALNL